MSFTWLGNRYFTFRDRRAHGLCRRMLQEWLKFVGANAAGRGGQLSSPRWRWCILPPRRFDNKFVAQACGVLAGLVFNFTLSRKLVFKKPTRA